MRSTKTWGWACLCALFAVAACSAPAFAKQPDTVKIAGDLFLAVDGSVDRVVLDDATPPAVKALVEQTVRRWRFEPVMREGIATRAHTAMLLDLERIAAEGGFKLRVKRVDFRPPRTRSARIVLPKLNTTLDVLTALRVDAGGNVMDVAVVYMGGQGPRLSPNAPLYAKEIERALKRSKFAPAALDYGDAADDTFFLPIEYRSSRNAGAAGSDPQQRFREMQPVPWLEGKAPTKLAESAAQAPGEPIALHRDEVKLRTDVVGATL